MFGFGNDLRWSTWKPKVIDNYQIVKRSSRALAATIILLGATGRVGPVAFGARLIELTASYFGNQEVIWYVGILGNVMFSAALLSAAQSLIMYSAKKYYEARQERADRLKSPEAWTPAEMRAADVATRLYLAARLREKGFTPPTLLPATAPTDQSSPLESTLALDGSNSA